MAPQARSLLALGGLPSLNVDLAGAPSMLDHEARRVPGVERGDEVPAMPTEGDGKAAVLGAGQIIALADVVETEQLHHHVMDGVPARRRKSDAVMPRVHVQEVDLVGPQEIVAQAEAENVAVERHHGFDALDMKHDMA